ncbi:hypothetical protein EAI_11792 [Harpegnathos saltator]|uniref:Uncharacterized protein n=1 Tax=Harpegnathos saltator TaxID=610380 RepID=E2B5M9_HARSA|nr:hypothetical protein EAI_11792 [Harpegnathos saltator]
MKFALALLALVAMTSAKIEISNIDQGELHKNIQESQRSLQFNNIKEANRDEGYSNMMLTINCLREFQTELSKWIQKKFMLIINRLSNFSISQKLLEFMKPFIIKVTEFLKSLS